MPGKELINSTSATFGGIGLIQVQVGLFALADGFLIGVLMILVAILQVACLAVSWATEGTIPASEFAKREFKAWADLKLEPPRETAKDRLAWATKNVDDWPDADVGAGSRLLFLDAEETTDETVAFLEDGLELSSGLRAAELRKKCQHKYTSLQKSYSRAEVCVKCGDRKYPEYDYMYY